jgi:hypothetical protein
MGLSLIRANDVAHAALFTQRPDDAEAGKGEPHE